MLRAGSTHRWSPGARAFSTAPATRTTVPLAHLADLPASLPESGYTVTPPVQPWPRRLTARSLSRLLLGAATPELAVLALRHALFHAAHPLPPSLPVFAAALSRLSHADAGAAARHLPPVLSLLRASRLPAFSDRPFLPLLRALRPLPSLRLFLSLPSFNSRPSTRSFNALLHSLVSARRLRLAAALFRAAPTKLYITPNLVSCNILLKGLVGIGDLNSALKVLDEMIGWGIVPDVVTYTTVLTAYCAKGDLEGAQQLFDDIIASGRRPDATMYTVLIDGYCHHRKLQDAARIMDEMGAAGVQPNEVTYSVVIEACCKERKSTEARDLTREMLGAGYVPDTPLCAKVVDVLCQDGKAGEANEMWRQMVKKSVPPDNTVVSTLIYWLYMSWSLPSEDSESPLIVLTSHMPTLSEVTGSRLSRWPWAIMATVGQSGALRRVTVHYANSPTGSTVAEVSFDDLDDELLLFVLADLLPGQEGLHQSILEGTYNNQENHMRGAAPSAPYGYSRPEEYRAESSTAAAAATGSRNSGMDEQIASDFEYAKQLQQEMEDLSVKDEDDNDISCVPSPSDSDDEHEHHDEEEEADRQEDGDGDDDPDNMTYEQGQALVESVGTEYRGLSDELISYLQPWKYKAVKASGLFSRKTNHEE
ncbi:Pentatricopeptide repeat-containing protein mitochondrial [Zea mays]|uniref:Pentatricopeptide repeat-containing protein mitochondrial n=2 Tax=Zea mays TaxID=4577 RepID=A0A1D6LK32_MAIZE|nr:Pentatricopeptide repeat-containing protein mitochondrial [Zea mays]